MVKPLDKNYLLKVLTLSGVPKLITFALTLISFPLMVRALGAENYGALVFVAASLSLFEVLMDFGVSSASGKVLAESRTLHPILIRREFFAWGKVQIFFIVVGFIPMMFGTYLLIGGNSEFKYLDILWILAIGVCFNVALNFLRSNLLSVLAFKYLAVLDATESIVRSSGLLIVAFWVPTTIGLAIAGSVTAMLSSLLALVLMMSQLKRHQTNDNSILDTSYIPETRLTLIYRLRESSSFLWSRFAFRLFQEGPIIIFGRLLGAEVVGIVTAFRKIIDILSTPYLVIGNGLKVRIHELKKQGGIEVMRKLWNTVTRILTTSFLFATLVFLLADVIAGILLPENVLASKLFLILSPLIFLTSASGLITPMTDYLGGLFIRNLLVTALSIMQLALLSLIANFVSESWSLFFMVALYGILILGYFFIAYHLLFNSYVMRFAVEHIMFLGLVLFSLLAANIFYYSFLSEIFIQTELIVVVMFIAIFCGGLIALKAVKKEYINSSFFEI